MKRFLFFPKSGRKNLTLQKNASFLQTLYKKASSLTTQKRAPRKVLFDEEEAVARKKSRPSVFLSVWTSHGGIINLQPSWKRDGSPRYF
jgi:hypothetical protein